MTRHTVRHRHQRFCSQLTRIVSTEGESGVTHLGVCPSTLWSIFDFLALFFVIYYRYFGLSLQLLCRYHEPNKQYTFKVLFPKLSFPAEFLHSCWGANFDLWCDLFPHNDTAYRYITTRNTNITQVNSRNTTLCEGHNTSSSDSSHLEFSNPLTSSPALTSPLQPTAESEIGSMRAKRE